MSLAAKAGGISRRRAYQVYESEPDFAELWDDALQEGIDKLEFEAQRRAFDGTNKPVFHQGAQCGVVREYSDTLAIFLLKAHRPERFRENSKLELAGSLQLTTLSDDDLEAEIASLAAQVGHSALSATSDDTTYVDEPATPPAGYTQADDCDDLV